MSGSKNALFGQRVAWRRDVDGIGKKERSIRYITEFVRLKCGPDLLALKVFPNAKEVTETVAAHAALREWPGASEFGKPWRAYVIGDGHAPRTGAFIAMMSAWEVVSIDPAMRDRQAWKNVRKLTTMRAKAEDCELPPGKAGTAIVCVHSHAPDLRAVWERIPGRKVCVAIPCCVVQDIGRAPDHEYEDFGIWSPERTVKVWKQP